MVTIMSTITNLGQLTAVLPRVFINHSCKQLHMDRLMCVCVFLDAAQDHVCNGHLGMT